MKKVGIKYRCIRKCFYKSRLYAVGEMLTTVEKPPRHFESVTKKVAPVKTQKEIDEAAIKALGHTSQESKPNKPISSKNKNKLEDEDFLK